MDLKNRLRTFNSYAKRICECRTVEEWAKIEKEMLDDSKVNYNDYQVLCEYLLERARQ